MRPLNIGMEKAWEKICHYCAYQERAHKEVKDKLYGFGLYPAEVDETMARLVEENYLNEERFAIAYAGGKFRMMQWGRQKIKYHLRMKGVSDYNIRIALKTIPEADYEKTVQKLAAAKWKSLKGDNQFTKMAKLQAYLGQKGYESPVITRMIQELL
jgi:regulatory protein